MPKITNSELVYKLLTSTQEDRIDWQPTAVPDQYSASFGGKWTVMVDEGIDEESGNKYFWLSVDNSEGETILKVFSYEDSRITDLFERAKRKSLKIDEALADLFNEIDKQQG